MALGKLYWNAIISEQNVSLASTYPRWKWLVSHNNKYFGKFKMQQSNIRDQQHYLVLSADRAPLHVVLQIFIEVKADWRQTSTNYHQKWKVLYSDWKCYRLIAVGWLAPRGIVLLA